MNRQLPSLIFYYRWRRSADVHWEANKDQEMESNSEIHKFIFVLQDKRQTIPQSVDSAHFSSDRPTGAVVFI